MGGRGSYSRSHVVDMRDGFHGRENWDRTHPAVAGPGSLKEALGNKGRAMGVSRALEGANPYYSPDHSEFSLNCQRAVVAYELRRRGYKVTAQPTYEGDRLPRYASTHGNGFWQGAFQKAKRENIGARSTEQARKNLANKMKSFGPGSRAIVKIQWKSGSGHVFNAENIGGKITYVDPQVNVRYNPKTILNGVKPGSVSVIRTDNLRVSSRAKESVWTVGA